MILNSQTSKDCQGVADFTVDPPVLKFNFSLNEASLTSCNNAFRVFLEMALSIVLSINLKISGLDTVTFNRPSM